MSVQRRTASASSLPHDRDERPTVTFACPDPSDYLGSAGEDPDDVVDEWEQALRGDDEPGRPEQPQYREPERSEPPQHRPESYQPEHSEPDPSLEQPTQVIDAVVDDGEAEGWGQRSYRDQSSEVGSIYSGTSYLRSNFASSSDSRSASGYQTSAYPRAEPVPQVTSQRQHVGSDRVDRGFASSDFGGLGPGRSDGSGSDDRESDYTDSDYTDSDYTDSDYSNSDYSNSDYSNSDDTDSDYRERGYRPMSFDEPGGRERAGQHSILAALTHPAPRPAPRYKPATELGTADEPAAALTTNPDRTTAAAPAERVDLSRSAPAPSTEPSDEEEPTAVGQTESEEAKPASAWLFAGNPAHEQADTAVIPRVTEDGLAGIDQPSGIGNPSARPDAHAQPAPGPERERAAEAESGSEPESASELPGGQQEADRQRDADLGDTAEWTLGQDWDDDEDPDGGDADQDGHPDGDAGPDRPDDWTRDGANQEARTEFIPRLYSDQAELETAEAVTIPPIRRAPVKPRRPVALVLVLVLVTLAAVAAAYYCWTKTQELARARAVSNLAFVDQTATADVRDQVSKAVEAIYSYDATRLDQSERRALSFITGSYADEFKRNFAMVRQLGPQQKAALTSTVSEAGVEMLTERRATLLLMVNQVGHRADTPQPLKAFVRLNVTAERMGGQWKVSGISQR